MQSVSDLVRLLYAGYREARDFLIPPRCWGCARLLDRPRLDDSFPSSFFCSSCCASVHLAPAETCPYCGQHGVSSTRECSRCHGRKRGFDCATAGAAYQGKIRDLVLQLKFGGVRNAAFPLALCLLHGLYPVLTGVDIDGVVAVPLHPHRFRTRGFNQAELMAEVVAGTLRIPLLRGVIYRQRNTLPQGAGGGGSRRANVKGAFAPVRDCFRLRMQGHMGIAAVKGCNILLVDDVLSTGATMEECSLVLHKAGAAYVHSATAAT